MPKNTLLISFLALMTVLPIQTEGKSPANSNRQNRPRAGSKTQEQVVKKDPPKTQEQAVNQEPPKTSDKTIKRKKIGVLGITLVGDDEFIKKQEAFIKKRVEDMRRAEEEAPKSVKENGRFPIKIIGSDNFIKKTEDALALIQEKSPRSYAIVTNYLSVIQSAKKSGINPATDTPTFHVGAPTFNTSVEWYASSIVHDSYHSKLYHDYRGKFKGKPVPAEVWSGREAENKCLTAQENFMRDINASETKIKSVQKMRHIDYFTIERDW